MRLKFKIRGSFLRKGYNKRYFFIKEELNFSNSYWCKHDLRNTHLTSWLSNIIVVKVYLLVL